MCLCFHLQVYGGMRGMKGLVYETSVLDPEEVSLPSEVTQNIVILSSGFIS